MKRFELTEEQVQALEIVGNLLDDLDLSSTKISLIEDIEEELKARKFEEEEEEKDVEIYGFTADDFFFGESAEDFLSELFGI